MLFSLWPQTGDNSKITTIVIKRCLVIIPPAEIWVGLEYEHGCSIGFSQRNESAYLRNQIKY